MGRNLQWGIFRERLTFWMQRQVQCCRHFPEVATILFNWNSRRLAQRWRASVGRGSCYCGSWSRRSRCGIRDFEPLHDSETPLNGCVKFCLCLNQNLQIFRMMSLRYYPPFISCHKSVSKTIDEVILVIW